MPIKLISGGGGSVSINPGTTASTINLTVPAVNGSVVTTGDSGTIVQSMLALNASSIGVGQTWQNVTASRTAGTTYTNTTGKPIFVAAQSSTSPSNGQGIVLSIDGISVGYGYFAYTTNQFGYTATGIVPPGSTYVVTVSATSIGSWYELR